jgi:hypothetical protein
LERKSLQHKDEAFRFYILIMNETIGNNYRTGLLWDLFMQDPEIKAGLDKLDFNY